MLASHSGVQVRFPVSSSEIRVLDQPFSFSVLIITEPLLHTHLSLPVTKQRNVTPSVLKVKGSIFQISAGT